MRDLAVITGASSGIGLEFARRLAAQHDLLLVARRAERLEELAKELRAAHGGQIDVLAVDLTDADSLAHLTERIAALPNLTLLINNAGFGYGGLFWEADLKRLQAMQALHVMAVVSLSHAALRGMVARGRGALINVASVASFTTRAGSASYGATKSWLAAFTEGLHLDLQQGKSKVQVQALCPGFTLSEFHDVMREDRRRLAPAGFWCTPQFVVEAALRALERHQVFVVPGWRYKLLVAVVTKLPLRWKHWVESRTPKRPSL
jgi:short-subunit dehydrogenase